jgi:hypothetical protein
MEAITGALPDLGPLDADHGTLGRDGHRPHDGESDGTRVVSHRERVVRESAPVFGLRRLLPPCAALISSLAFVACGDDGGGSVEAFCADLAEHGSALMNPDMTTQADVEAYLALHDEIGADVPLAIEQEWTVYADALRTAAAVVPGDTAGVEAARRAMFAAEESAFEVYTWTGANCALDLATLGPVARYDSAATTTTIPSTTVAG